MAQFLDKTGRPWLMEFTFGSLARVKAETGVDLLTLHAPNSPALRDMQEDHCKLLQVLLVQLRPQLQERGIADDEFAESLLEEHVMAAAEALMEGMVDYYPPAKRAALQPLMQRMLGAARRVRDRATQDLTRAVGTVNFDQLEREMEEAITRSISGSSIGSSPASSDSTPAP